VSAGIVRLHGEGLAPLRNGGRVLTFFSEIGGDVVLLVEINRGRIDVVDAAGIHVDELGNVDCAIGGGGVLNEDGRRVVAVFIDVREKHFGVRATALGGEDEPAAVGRPTVP